MRRLGLPPAAGGELDLLRLHRRRRAPDGRGFREAGAEWLAAQRPPVAGNAEPRRARLRKLGLVCRPRLPRPAHGARRRLRGGGRGGVTGSRRALPCDLSPTVGGPGGGRQPSDAARDQRTAKRLARAGKRCPAQGGPYVFGRGGGAETLRRRIPSTSCRA
jgi:hypothetical protein